LKKEKVELIKEDKNLKKKEREKKGNFFEVQFLGSKRVERKKGSAKYSIGTKTKL